MDKKELYLRYVWEKHKERWELSTCSFSSFQVNPEQRVIPKTKRKPSTKNKYKIGFKFDIFHKGVYRNAIITGYSIFIHPYSDDPKWTFYYILDWTGSGHTGGFFTEEQLEI